MQRRRNTWDDNDAVNDADSDPTNEHNTSVSLAGTVLTVTDGGGGKTADLASLQDGTGTDDQNISGSGLFWDDLDDRNRKWNK